MRERVSGQVRDGPDGRRTRGSARAALNSSTEDQQHQAIAAPHPGKLASPPCILSRRLYATHSWWGWPAALSAFVRRGLRRKRRCALGAAGSAGAGAFGCVARMTSSGCGCWDIRMAGFIESGFKAAIVARATAQAARASAVLVYFCMVESQTALGRRIDRLLRCFGCCVVAAAIVMNHKLERVKTQRGEIARQIGNPGGVRLRHARSPAAFSSRSLLPSPARPPARPSFIPPSAGAPSNTWPTNQHTADTALHCSLCAHDCAGKEWRF